MPLQKRQQAAALAPALSHAFAAFIERREVEIKPGFIEQKPLDGPEYLDPPACGRRAWNEGFGTVALFRVGVNRPTKEGHDPFGFAQDKRIVPLREKTEDEN